tara:strand:+ start:718 stop:1053 length:336 start_codon:yes stop_codon:yes gene_type:complete
MITWVDHLDKHLFPSSGRTTVQQRAAKWLVFGILRDWAEDSPELSSRERIKELTRLLYPGADKYQGLNYLIHQRLRAYYGDKSVRQFEEAQNQMRRVLIHWEWELKREGVE